MNTSLRPSTEDAILEAAFALFRENPGTSLADIAAKAGVGRATLHRYFPSRDDLVRALALTAISEMDAAADAACEDASTHAEALRRCLDALIPLGDRHGFLATEPLDDPAILSAFERQTEETLELVEAAKAEGVFAGDVPATWIVQAYDHLLYAAWECVKDGELTHAQAAKLAWRSLTTGLGPDGK